jgi:tetratricopeptide (TPR) repeat protein
MKNKKHFPNALIISAFSLSLSLSPILHVSAEDNPTMAQNKYSPSPMAMQLENRGIELGNQGDYVAAIEVLYEAWKLNPEKSNDFAENLSKTLNNYAAQLAKANKLDEALYQLRKGIFFQDDNKMAFDNMDSIYKMKSLNPNDINVRLTEARKLRADGQLEQSVSEYKKSIDLSKAGTPENYKAKIELAQVYQVVFGKYIPAPSSQPLFYKAIELSNQAIKENPKDFRPYLVQGRAYLTAEKLPEAIDAFEKALKQDGSNDGAMEGLVGTWKKVVQIAPNEQDNLLGLSNALIRSGHGDEAKQVLEKAKGVNPNNPEIDKLIATSKEKSNEVQSIQMAEKALEAQKAGKIDDAITLYEVAVRRLPPVPATSDVYYNLGLAYQARSRTADAIQAYNQALKFNPANDDAKKAIQKISNQIAADKLKKTSEQAVSLQSQGKTSEAIAIYQNILKDNPQDAQTHFNLGTAYQEAGKVNEALSEYQVAAQIDSKNSEYSSAVALLKQSLNNNAKTDQVNDLIREAIELQQAGKTGESIQKYKKAIEMDTASAQAHFNLGTAYHSSNQTADAIKEYREAYTLDPAGYPEANYFIANLLETQKDNSRAIAYYKRYLEDQAKGEYSEAAKERIKVLN